MGNRSFANKMEFINATLTNEQDEQFTAWFQSKDRSVDKGFDQAFADEYRISIGWDGENQTFIASMTWKGEKGDNTGKCLTARADSWLEAMAMVTFKHLVLFDGGNWYETTAGRKRG